MYTRTTYSEISDQATPDMKFEFELDQTTIVQSHLRYLVETLNNKGNTPLYAKVRNALLVVARRHSRTMFIEVRTQEQATNDQ
ncbi:hypothetical protein BFJ68_g17810 [Fusarium oxysporum]|uniref:Uncharacterized protein n=1 Tax=Fusarium oxysporum TaxID=5507 RepID=A0A420N2W6_FUSOX|nr:hypothetical protein BFJ71_g17242 [Fusarium oxysporum]RKK79382.1 hypothetical protein BFJ68_g17810 [Fusarium oxysporum]